LSVVNSLSSSNWLRSAAPYINSHRGCTFVLMIPSSAILHANFSFIVQDLALLHSLGVRLVLVCGVRKYVEKQLLANNLPNIYQQNLRITCRQTLNCVMEQTGKLQAKLFAKLSVNITGSPLAGAKMCVANGNFVTAKPYGVIDGIDLQYTGKVRKVDARKLNLLLDNQIIPLITPICSAPTGEVFNVSAHEIAMQVATNMQADKLILFDQTEGIFNDGKLIREIALNNINDYLPHPLLEIANYACKNNVKRCHLISYQINGALLDELFTRKGSGTLVIAQSLEVIRCAHHADIGAILDLINPLEQQGILVKRSRAILTKQINNFYVITIDKLIVGCAALYPQQNGSAELACLVVHQDYQKQGFAEKLLKYAEQLALQQQIKQIFILTTHTDHWFIQHGFTKADISDLPLERANLYNYQRKSKILIKQL